MDLNAILDQFDDTVEEIVVSDRSVCPYYEKITALRDALRDALGDALDDELLSDSESALTEYAFEGADTLMSVFCLGETEKPKCFVLSAWLRDKKRDDWSECPCMDVFRQHEARIDKYRCGQ